MGFLSTVSQYKYRKILFSDFLTDTPEIMRENILCELEGIAQYFGKFTSKIPPWPITLGIDRYQQQQAKASIPEESSIQSKMKEIDSCLGELQRLVRDEYPSQASL